MLLNLWKVITAKVYLEILEIQPAKVICKTYKSNFIKLFRFHFPLFESKSTRLVDAAKLAITEDVSGLDLKDARGHSYDGCGAMTGK